MMGRPYSVDLPERVLQACEAGEERRSNCPAVSGFGEHDLELASPVPPGRASGPQTSRARLSADTG
jgi:hypothetical protein